MGLDGMGMMLKSLGINPDEIKASIEGFKNLATQVAETQKSIDAKLSTILLGQTIAAQDRGQIICKLDELLARGEEVQGKEDMVQLWPNNGAPIPAVEDPADFERKILGKT